MGGKFSVKGVLMFVAMVAVANVALGFIDSASGGMLGKIGAR